MWHECRIAPSTQYIRDAGTLQDRHSQRCSKACHIPVLWPVQEYEKRLLAKDHEIKAAQADARELQKRLDQATAELADTSRLIPAAPAAPQGDATTIH